tara:strand:+ start:19 stop:429 length:411 start_codon:yes stop_codon:yes gene_type:complete
MKKGPFKMKGPGLKTGDRISKRPASTASKAIRGFDNIPKQFSKTATSKMSQATRSTLVNNAASGTKQFARAVKKSLPKIGRAASKVAKLGLRGSVVGGVIMAAGESMYKRGKKAGFKPPQFKKAEVNKKFNFNKKK